MVFLTNNMEWAVSSIGELYLARWGIEVFFKQIKKTLKVCDFLCHTAGMPSAGSYGRPFCSISYSAYKARWATGLTASSASSP